MLAGDWYIADDPEIAARQARAVRLAAQYRQAFEAGADDARSFLAELIADLGEDAVVRPPLFVDYGTQISIWSAHLRQLQPHGAGRGADHHRR